ncbi:hypothetical protein [Acididesulfobacillus acetoxydans]|nr:hypothetical protein [Acididesulfobacillus acetoxydans]
MPKTFPPSNYGISAQPALEKYFIQTGFYDLLPLALQLAEEQGFNQDEIFEAICKVNNKFGQYPPTKNRTAWFETVFQEKLKEARGDILAFQAARKFRQCN